MRLKKYNMKRSLKIGQNLPQGFTLLELLIVIALLGLLVSMGVPALSTQSSGWQAEFAAKNIQHLMQRSRIRAAQSGQAVVICGMGGEGSSTMACESDWGDRVVAFADQQSDGKFSPNDRIVLQSIPHLAHQGLQIRANRTSFRVRPNGTLNSSAGSIFICPTVKAQRQRVVVDRLGRTRVEVLGLNALGDKGCG